MEHIYLPLQGPEGTNPKAPAVGAWSSPGYAGIELSSVGPVHGWVGMRTDGLVVVDCDSQEAAQRWLEIDSYAQSGWVRKTPRGVHFLYRQTDGSPDGPLVAVWPGIDIRAGRGAQVVMFAEGYCELHAERFMMDFHPAWMPQSAAAAGWQPQRTDEAWDEMPAGRGNNTMAAFAGAFRKQGMSPRTMARCLSAINHITMTEEPMPHAMIAEIVLSVARYRANPDIDIEIEE